MPDEPLDPPGPDETRTLLALVQEWARRNLPEPPSGHPGPECQWCPLCQFASILRGEHPELSERVAEAGTAVVHAVRALLDNAAHRAAASAPSAGSATHVQHIHLDDPPGGTPPAPERPAPRPRVHRIPLDDTPHQAE